ncbi:MAG: sigma 54 modulation protein/ribosomal protein [Rariglobus sp.]|jgi:putative sigma-54 modulation protein|nr:sigma 54 modulation protein/ribosomal protein [Rariglobus sp.]
MKTPGHLDSKLIIQGVHLELTEALQAAIREKFAVLLRHNEFIVRINVRLAQDQTLGNEHHYRATAQIEIGGPDLVATADGKEAYSVMDELVEKLTRLLERRHGLRKDRRNHPREIELDANIPKAD